MDLKEAVKTCRRPTAKEFIVGQNTNHLLTKDPKASDVLVVDGKLGYNDNLLYDNYLDTINLKNSKNL